MDDTRTPSPAQVFKGRKQQQPPTKRKVGTQNRNHPNKGNGHKGHFERMIESLLEASSEDVKTTGQQLKGAYDEGFEKGREQGRRDLVDFLEARYTSKRGPDRGTPEAKALLDLAGQAARFLRGEPIEGPLGDHR